jgi:hypothetical protein
MTPFSLNLIDSNIDISNRDGLGRRFVIAIISMAILFGLIYVLPFGWSLFLFFFVLIIVNRWTRRMQKDWVTPRHCKGQVNFSDLTIVIPTLSVKIQLKDISQIKLLGDYYQGFTIGSRDIVHNGLYDIIITSKDGQQGHFKFIVFNKNEFQELTEFFELLYSNFKIDIAERIGSERMTGFLLRHDRTYKNIQELKQQHSLRGQQNCT